MIEILLLAGLLHLALLLCHGTYIALTHGIGWGMGRRSNQPNLTDLDRRFERTIANSTEGMIAFVPIGLAAFLLGNDANMILLAAQVFVAARLLFAVLYLSNIPYIRTVVWLAGVASTLAIGVSTLTLALREFPLSVF